MRGRLLILVGLILLLVVIVVVVLSTNLLGGGTSAPAATSVAGGGTTQQPVAPIATPIPRVSILISVQNLPRGYRFPDTEEALLNNVVAWRDFPEDTVPFDAMTFDQVEAAGGLERVIGDKIARTDIPREAYILSAQLVSDLSEIASVGSDAAAVLPADRVAVTIPIDRETSVGYAVRDGDFVDVLVSMLFVDVDEIFQSLAPNRFTLITQNADGTFTLTTSIEGRTDVTNLGPVVVSPSERQRPRMVVQRTIQAALVVHVGNFPLNGRFIGIAPTSTPVPQADSGSSSQTRATVPPPTAVPLPEIVTLGVTPQDAVILIWLREAKIPMTLALRSALDQSQSPTDDVTLDYIMSRFRIDVPGKRDYSIEPAIRSIRQLVTGEEISLTNPGN
ncbi:MAG: hypothetical protein H6672_20835 [Anaerolineaceae bacterium]|nr:hypothetical protein [Anaerolineaceae bacterium]